MPPCSATTRITEHQRRAAVTTTTMDSGLTRFQTQSCEHAVNLPFMLGYGGINVVLMPSKTVYYYFSDGGTFGWLAAARESDHIKPYCPQRGTHP